MVGPLKENNNSSKNCPDHLANERTYLAWIRTAIAIIAFGFVIERFSLFMKQMSFIVGKTTFERGVPSSLGYSAVIGILLVAFGTLMSVLAFLKFKKTQQQIEQGAYQASTLLEWVLAVSILIVGVFLVIYLVNSVS